MVPIFPERDERNLSSPAGLPGKYTITFILSRPRHVVVSESVHNWSDVVKGDSHLAITPKNSPDAVAIKVRTNTEEDRTKNQAVVDLLNRIAQRKNASAAQIALAWLLAQKPWIVPIPGTTKIHRLEENIGSASVELTTDDLDEINAAASKIPIQGERLPESILRMSYR